LSYDSDLKSSKVNPSKELRVSQKTSNSASFGVGANNRKALIRVLRVMKGIKTKNPKPKQMLAQCAQCANSISCISQGKENPKQIEIGTNHKSGRVYLALAA
jgi:hypothetical protein